jgi:hypothetical protein
MSRDEGAAVSRSCRQNRVRLPTMGEHLMQQSVSSPKSIGRAFSAIGQVERRFGAASTGAVGAVCCANQVIIEAVMREQCRRHAGGAATRFPRRDPTSRLALVVRRCRLVVLIGDSFALAISGR